MYYKKQLLSQHFDRPHILRLAEVENLKYEGSSDLNALAQQRNSKINFIKLG